MLERRLDLTGQKFGRLLVISRESDLKRCSRWKCKCDCGNEKIAFTVRLRNKQCTSCGCLLKEQMKTRFRKHGLSSFPSYQLLKYARKRARDLNLEFNIDLSDIIIPQYCPILGVELIKSGNYSDNQPSLDRVDSSKGYVKGNVAIVSLRANRLKQDATIDELEGIIKYIKNQTAKNILSP